MPLSKKLIVTFGGFMLTSLLSACSLFDSRPKQMTIEYDEEVKLHNGEMIWVHITRHYVLTGGGALGDTGAFRRHYIPKEVEISWDTGFEGVGRKSVFFDERIAFIDKYDGVWYLVGTKNTSKEPLKINSAINCMVVGVLVNSNHDCLVTIDHTNEIVDNFSQDLASINMNILYTVGLRGSGLFPNFLNNTKLFWSEKLELQKTQPSSYQSVNKPYSYDLIQK